MRHFYMTVIQRRDDYEGAFATEPFEAAWAGEAIFFVRVEKIHAETVVNARVQISADGLNWIDEGTALAPQSAEGDSFIRVSHFGGWLRLAGEVSGSGPAQLTVQLALKE
jgi:hypothetical protein